MPLETNDGESLPFDPLTHDWLANRSHEPSLFEKEWFLLKEECPTDEDCMEELIITVRANDPATCGCGSRSFQRKYGEREGKCKKCRKWKWFLSEYEFFRGLKKPRLYLLLLRVLSKGLVFNKSQLAKASEVYYSTSWNLLSKLAAALLVSLTDAEDLTEIDSAVFAAVFMRRSSETPAQKAPIFEQQAFEEAESGPGSDAETDDVVDDSNQPNNPVEDERLAQLTPLQQAVFELIGAIPVTFESLKKSLDDSSNDSFSASVSSLLSALTVLELSGLIVCLAGDRYVRADQSSGTAKPASKPIKRQASIDVAASAIEFIRATYGGVSRKYLQYYIADFCRVVNHRLEKALFSATNIISATAEIGFGEVRAYVSPLRVIILA